MSHCTEVSTPNNKNNILYYVRKLNNYCASFSFKQATFLFSKCLKGNLMSMQEQNFS